MYIYIGQLDTFTIKFHKSFMICAYLPIFEVVICSLFKISHKGRFQLTLEECAEEQFKNF